MKKAKLEDFFRGWFVGNFEPSLLKSNFEVGIAKHTAGEYHQDHFHKKAIEINVVLEGKMTINGEEFGPGDIFILYPYEVSQAVFLTDVTVVIVRDKSDPQDKYNFDIK
jgi:oxalate decarboxylase/phosphoglucose isomerase-like protein (cupin superfamily)